LDELATVGHSFVAYSGGEPSLWRDGEKGLADLLAATAQRALSPLVVTNGSLFRDDDFTRAFLDRYLQLTDARAQVHVSVDHWHRGTWLNGRSPALETFLRCRDEHGRMARLEVTIVSLWCLDDVRNVPPEEFSKYTDAGIGLHYLPLSPLGSPEVLSSIAPRLCPTGTDKSSLGSYGERARQQMDLSEDDWSALDNSELLASCSAGDTLTLDLDRNWWLCCDQARRRLRVAAVGHLSAESIAGCLARSPLVASFLQTGFLDTLRQCSSKGHLMPSAVAKAALRACHPYGISGRASCGLCLSLPESVFS
jgi:hypothetical protein